MIINKYKSSETLNERTIEPYDNEVLEYLVEQYGEEKTKEYILSNRDSEATRNLEMQARFYGIVRDVNGIKRSLRPYIKM